MLESRQPPWLVRVALCGGTGFVVCAGAALPACHSNRAAPAPADGAAPQPNAQTPKPSTAKPPAAPIKIHRIGEIARTKDYRFRVERVKHCETEPYFRPRSGNMKLGVEVTIESRASTPVTINPFYAWIRDSRGRSYYFTLAGCEPTLEASRLEPEQDIQGWLTFEVPEGAKDLELSYGPPTTDHAAPEVRFALRRE